MAELEAIISATDIRYLDNAEFNEAVKTYSDSLEARVDNLATLEEGSTTGDAELIDGRVGADGKTYTNIGGAIRGQISELKEDIGDLGKGEINIHESAEIKGYFYSSNMVLQSNNSARTKIFKIESNKSYYLSNTIPFLRVSYSDSDSIPEIGDSLSDYKAYDNTDKNLINSNHKWLLVYYSNTQNIGGKLRLFETQTYYATSDDLCIINNKINSISIISDIGSVLDIAEGYFNQAYGADTHLVYDNTHGLFAPQTTSSVVGEEGFPAIVCSQFSQALMKGIKYSESRYVKEKNHISGWGYTTDGSGTYQYTSEDITDNASLDYMIAKEQLHYAIEKGSAYKISDIRKQVRPGDFVFYGLSGIQTWEDVTHVAYVLHVGLDDNYMITLESDDITLSNGKRVGVTIKRFSIDNGRSGNYQFGARFPIDASTYIPLLIFKDSNIVGRNTTYYIKQYNITEQTKGFYTCIIEGKFDATRIEIGLHYTDASEETFDYTRGRVVNNGNRYVVTFYADRQFDRVRLGASENNNYNINKLAFFKGYYGQDWIIPN